MTSPKPVYKRIILKISGEAMKGRADYGIDHGAVEEIAKQILELQKLKVETAVVIGGGNFIRGTEFVKMGIKRVPADYMGLLATVINGIALTERLERLGAQVRLFSAGVHLDAAEPFVTRRALAHLEKGRIIILTGGTGNPLFTTDTCAALRAAELDADVVFKATKVDGVYDSDPLVNSHARRIPRLSYLECLKRELKVMDAAAISLCYENKLPIVIFNMFEKNNIIKAVCGESVGSIVEV